MNHFELYGIPVTLTPDQATVSRTYIDLQRKYHPDRFGQASEAEQEEALQLSAQVNKAFQVFKQPLETIRYVLELKGLLEEEEKYQLSPDFLMEMMELNELREEGDLEQVRSTIEQIKQDIYAPVASIITNYQEDITTQEDLLQVKEYYFKCKYLMRLI